MNYRYKEQTVKISETNKILQKYRNSALTYDLIRRIVYDMKEITMAPTQMENNDIRMIYE